jgi:hypothetical protein
VTKSARTSKENSKSVYPLLAGSIAIGAADDSAFFFFQIGSLSDGGFHWMMAALLSWMALFVVAVHLLGVRSLWLLFSLPLVLLPFALAAIGAAQI